jgi:hypothetical protein
MEINGKKVVDATRKLKINITKADTVKGANKNPGSCAAARACCRLPKVLSARVHLGRVYIEQKDKWLRFQTSEALRSEVIAFDRGGSFAPGQYQLRPLSPSGREETRKKRWARTETNRNKYGSSPTKGPRRVLRVHRAVPDVRTHGANK